MWALPLPFALTQMGVRVAGIIDRNGGIISEQGLGFDEVKGLLPQPTRQCLGSRIICYPSTK
jgi:hypothetical protein